MLPSWLSVLVADGVGSGLSPDRVFGGFFIFFRSLVKIFICDSISYLLVSDFNDAKLVIYVGLTKP